MMMLSQGQIELYKNDGFLFLPNHFSVSEINVLRKQLPQVYAEDSPGRVFEKGTNSVRAVHGVHQYNDIFARLIRYSALLNPAKQILGSQVYVHQFKITAKPAFVGDIWQWHQDAQYWVNKDNLPTDQALSIVIFLSEVNEFNGPLMLVPGSHKAGILGRQEKSAKMDCESHMTSELPDTIEAKVLAEYVHKREIVAPKGEAGSALLFHASTFHASAPNLSPYDRELLIVSYNSVKNRPIIESPRPDFLAGKDYTALHPLAQDRLAL